MNDNFIYQLATAYNQLLKERRNEDYELNQPQFDKMKEIIDFLDNLLSDDPEYLLEIDLIPKEVHGWITVYCNVFDTILSQITEFSKIITYCSAISIDCTLNCLVCISMTIPNVYVKKMC